MRNDKILACRSLTVLQHLSRAQLSDMILIPIIGAGLRHEQMESMSAMQ
jgi:hypothetical protein